MVVTVGGVSTSMDVMISLLKLGTEFVKIVPERINPPGIEVPRRKLVARERLELVPVKNASVLKAKQALNYDKRTRI